MADAPDRRERLLNLLAALLETRPGLTRDDIVTNVSLGYPPAPESARKAFERDKASLRAMGVPVREDVRDNESRYRVDPKEYYLPDLELSDEELAALHVAVTGISLGAGGGEGAGALMKLGGLEGTGGLPVAELPLVDTLAPLFDASRRRCVVEISYRGRARRVEPWGLTSKFGHWYVVGQDLGSGEMRVFRADRIEGDVVATEPDAFTVPGDFRADAYLGRPALGVRLRPRDAGANPDRCRPRRRAGRPRRTDASRSNGKPTARSSSSCRWSTSTACAASCSGSSITPRCSHRRRPGPRSSNGSTASSPREHIVSPRIEAEADLARVLAMVPWLAAHRNVDEGRRRGAVRHLP